MRWFVGLVGAACLMSTTAVRADSELLQKKNCLACHGVDKRKYGPKLIEVAAKYGEDAKAAEALAKKIKEGGTGVWGEDVMPPQPHVSDADARRLAEYILKLKPPGPE